MVSDILCFNCEHDPVDATVVYNVTVCMLLSLPLPNEISGSQVPAHILTHKMHSSTSIALLQSY